jgi:hypothetical protein
MRYTTLDAYDLSNGLVEFTPENQILFGIDSESLKNEEDLRDAELSGNISEYFTLCSCTLKN